MAGGRADGPGHGPGPGHDLRSSSAEAAAAKAQKRTEFSFEEDTIEGDLSRPDGEYVEAVKRVPHSNLIKIREEYREKVMQSVDEL